MAAVLIFIVAVWLATIVSAIALFLISSRRQPPPLLRFSGIVLIFLNFPGLLLLLNPGFDEVFGKPKHVPLGPLVVFLVPVILLACSLFIRPPPRSP